MRKLFVILFLITTAVLNSYSQNYEPLDLAKKIFGKDSMPDIGNYVIGEYKGRPNGLGLRKGSTTKFLLLDQTDKKAVVAMTVLDSTGKGHDAYLHFTKNSSWKMNAFRIFALTGIIEQAKNELEKLTPQQVDDIIKSSKKNKKGNEYSLFTSKEDYEFELGNARLTLDLDDKIMEHFLKNETEFERIRNSILNELHGQQIDKAIDMNVGDVLKPDYRKLFISSVTTGGYEFGNCINFLIGGMEDNSVGYLYTKDKNDLPEINPNRIIMLREIGSGWYIYKTT
jgi:hypothetical protein